MINALIDPWVSLISINKWPTYINVNVDLGNMKVSTFVTSTKEWNLSFMSSLLSTEIMTNISMISIDKKNDHSNQLI